MFRDRDYLLDRAGCFLRVIGDYHPAEGVVSYVKYFPASVGIRAIQGQPGLFGYNSFVSKSFTILPQPGRACFSPYQGGIVPCTPYGDIVRHFSCQQKLQEIWQRREEYRAHPVGGELIAFLESIQGQIDWASLGITGSFLIDAHNASSDIDLVCYGREAYAQMSAVFQASPLLTPYSDPSQQQRLFQRRMIHLASMDLQVLITQEARKLQGVTRRGTHLNCQPLRDVTTQGYSDLQMIEVGEASCIVEILDHDEGYYAPAFYPIRVTDVLDSLFRVEYMRASVQVLISFTGVYSSTFRTGDRVYVSGKVVQITRKDRTLYGLEVTPWNTGRFFQANLLSSRSDR